MKNIYILFLLLASFINVYSQKNKASYKRASKVKLSKSNARPPSGNVENIIDTIVQPRETVTEKYLKGSTSGKQIGNTAKSSRSARSNPFVAGIHADPNAGEKFDTTKSDLNPNSINNNNNLSNATLTPVAAPNDTISNINTVTDNNLTTNSGAVDRSGNAQFGQSNWGNSRSTVGESQWTVPPPVTASFIKEYPTARNAIWSRSNQDSTIYSARYKSGDFWVTTNYSVSGQRLEMRSEVPLTTLPRAVSNYVSKLPTNLPVTTISKWQVLGKADVYEIQTRSGKTFYVNSDGAEVTY